MAGFDHDAQLAGAGREGALQPVSRGQPQGRAADGYPAAAEIAVRVPIKQWRRLQHAARPTLKELLLAEWARSDDFTPVRRPWRLRPPPEFE
jgi:hypothetical protein